MARELEIKLAVRPDDLTTIRARFASIGDGTPREETLDNIYFDTPLGHLNQARIALRIRRSPSGYVQTLKTKGAVSGGVHDRQEWDWPLQQPELDSDALAATPLSGEVDPQSLRPVFRTDFVRTTALWQGEGCRVEWALDVGEISAEGACAQARRVPLTEVELELKEGSVNSLMSQALTLATECPVLLNVVSKAEQGYCLAGLFRPGPVELSALDWRATIDAWFQALGFYALTGQAAFLEQAVTAIQRLASQAQGVQAPGAAPSLAPEQWQGLIQCHSRWVPGTPAQARAQLLQEPLLGQCQLTLLSS